MDIEELKSNHEMKVDELGKFTRIQVREDEDNAFYQNLAEYIKSCDREVSVANKIMGSASKEEFLQAEEIIQEIVKDINPDWTKKQKAAYVHYEMGKRISYVPDFKFRGSDLGSKLPKNAKNIWKSIVEGQSVCNGVTAIERNILSRVGVSTREISSKTHSFLLVETDEGNIISDATWDLKNSLYGSKPMYFGKTYEQVREIEKGQSNAHKLENPPENVIEIPDKELREIFHSLGYTDEDRKFLFPMYYKIQEIKDKEHDSQEEMIDEFLDMFTQDFSEEATHLSETRDMLEGAMNELGISSKDLTTKFVYQKSDEECEKPLLSLFVKNEQGRNQIKLLDIDEMQFKGIDVIDFDKEYKPHDFDTVQPFWKQYLPQMEKTYRENEMEEKTN